MRREEETHDELMRAFRQYFEANQKWVNRGTRRAGMDARYWLSEIRRICSARRVKVQEWREWKNEDMKQIKAKRKANQNQDKGTPSDTN